MSFGRLSKRRRSGFYNCGCEACKSYFGTGPDNPNWIPLTISSSFREDLKKLWVRIMEWYRK